MRGGLILNVIHITGTRMIGKRIDSLYMGNNLGGMSSGLNPLQFFPLDQGVVVISAKLEP